MLKITKVLVLGFILMLWMATAAAYDLSKHADKKGKGKHGGHHYFMRKGPPEDIPAHIKERLGTNWKDGTAINLNGSQVGIPGMKFMAEYPPLKNVVSMALKTNNLTDEGVKILASSDAT